MIVYLNVYYLLIYNCEKKKRKNGALKFEKPLFCCFFKIKKNLNLMTFLSCEQTLTCLFESLETNLEAVWKKEGHTSSAQLP